MFNQPTCMRPGSGSVTPKPTRWAWPITANHLIWMEIGRVEYCRSIGIRYKDMEECGGILLAVVEVHCRYRHPARYDDEVAVRTRVETLGSRGACSSPTRLSLIETGDEPSRTATRSTCFATGR